MSIDEKKMGIDAILSQINQDDLPPVDSWNPDYCGEIDMVIKADGSWHYMGTPIGRERMVRLFSRVLRREADGSFVLVTPVEKIGIRVEDAPFVATLCERFETEDGPALAFETNVGDKLVAGADNPIRVEYDKDQQPRPYIRVRGGLDALIGRAVFYDLVAWAEEKDGALWVKSGKSLFKLGSLKES